MTIKMEDESKYKLTIKKQDKRKYQLNINLIIENVSCNKDESKYE